MKLVQVTELGDVNLTDGVLSAYVGIPGDAFYELVTRVDTTESAPKYIIFRFTPDIPVLNMNISLAKAIELNENSAPADLRAKLQELITAKRLFVEVRCGAPVIK